MTSAASVDWRERYHDKLMSAEEAMRVVRPGATVWLGAVGALPMTLCAGLAALAPELSNVSLACFLTPFDWDRPELVKSFRLATGYAGPLERAAVREGRFDFVPVAGFREGRMPNGFDIDIDVAAIPISSPNMDGYCSFGANVLFSPTVVQRAKTLVGEVHPEYIRTGGQNSVHISRFSRLAEAVGSPAPVPIPPRSEETVLAAEVICTLVATDLIPDRSTLQIGLGDVSAALALYLTDKQDLGIHTELLPGGITDLVEQGAVTGKYKEIHPGKVVASFAAQLSQEELRKIDGNPVFELYDFSHTDDMRVLLQLERFVAVNNALFVDITGNVCAETMGPRVFTGPGGQPTFAYAASVTNAHSIIVLPSSQLVGETRHPRIVAMLPEGSTQTVHRAFVDYVVTEQGIAHLTNKSLRERIRELISVTHPDFRAELRRQAGQLYGITA